MQDQDKPAALVRAVAGIDAAITARHHIALRDFFDDGTEHLSRFTIDPTLPNLKLLTELCGTQAFGPTLSTTGSEFARLR